MDIYDVVWTSAVAMAFGCFIGSSLVQKQYEEDLKELEVYRSVDQHMKDSGIEPYCEFLFEDKLDLKVKSYSTKRDDI